MLVQGDDFLSTVWQMAATFEKRLEMSNGGNDNRVAFSGAIEVFQGAGATNMMVLDTLV